MKHSVMFRIGGLVPQKITVGTGFFEKRIAFAASFAQRQCDGTVRIPVFDPLNQTAEYSVCIIAVLSTLQYKGAKTKVISFKTAGQDFFFREPIAAAGVMIPADAAVETVIPANVADLDQPPHKHMVSVDFFALSIRTFCQFSCRRVRAVFYEKNII